MKTPLPAVVICGFLGAGKTTLLNRLLAHGLSGARIGLIVNDFGELNVDRRLVHGGGEHPLRELSNGCVCCSLQLGLAEAVRALALRGDLDLLVIEASGISMSSALLHALESAALADAVRVSRVVAVVDARRYGTLLYALPVIRDQVAHADLILLNHCDEVDAATTGAAKDRLRRENPHASIAATRFGDIDVEQFLTGAASAPRTLEHPAHHEQHWHAYEVVMPDAFDVDQLLTLVGQLPETVERVKGIVGRADGLHVLQKVGPFPPTLEPYGGAPDDGARNTLVVVARQAIEERLQHVFGPRATISAT